ncbi:ABC-F family ATP-binding cassette domain-containing protein [Nocardia higoensis]|uniref:ABC-F family ATP-binding cassette domain-containing protein n=1 Tax=Nocardia higoensis TaxID=228599 RepID=UPI001FDF5625|nr:ATP-binding cassette domain-containing protein [Nocardia higoensis]
MTTQANPATQLTLRGIEKSYGPRLVLDKVSLSVAPGERVGIVGENGSGKSTLLRITAGIESPDAGVVVCHAPGGVGIVEQTLDAETVGGAIDSALAEVRELERAMQRAAEAQDMEAYGELLTAFEARDGYRADLRVEQSMHGLGLGQVGREREVATLSGGEGTRLALACLLAASPEILLLDEPTNHLDDAALTWLEERLRAHRGTVVVVSHDRVFLDRVATAVVRVEEGAVTRFGGGYSQMLAAEAAARRRWEEDYARWCVEIERLREFSRETAHRVAVGRGPRDNNKMAYDRHAGRVQSSVSSRVRQAAEKVRRLEADPVPRPPEPLRFRAGFHAARPARFDLGVLALGPGERLLIYGPNGTGKSRLLDRMYATVSGRVGYLRQEERFDPRQSVVQAYGGSRSALPATGLFRADALDQPVGALSEGQRRRLSLARLLAGEHDLLLLDEPTNHLSLRLVEELEQALAEYRGALVVVTHDRGLRRRFRGVHMEVGEFA